MNRALIVNAISNAGNTLKRFWATFIFAFVGVVAAICLTETIKDTIVFQSTLKNLSFASFLGIGLSISIALFAESNHFSSFKKNSFQIAGLALIAVYFFTLPVVWNSVHFLRAGLLIISLHCLVAFAAFMMKGSVEGFWQFNKTLFIHILISLLYTSVLYLGISLAMSVMDNLFDFRISSNLYINLWIFLVGIFNTWFFLSGVPADFDELNHRTDYPKGLKIFTQFILIPLVTIYFVILYAYMGKMIFQWSLPKGVVSFLVVGFSVFGILSLLLIYPLQNLSSEKWIKVYSRWFYRALLPLIGLLFLAIGTRISDYGITESRYLIVLLACWLAGVSVYLQINKLHNIKIIPITLCLITALSSFGPWGAVSVSKHSQLVRFKEILSRNGLLINGKLVEPVKEIPENDQKELSSLITYLHRDHGVETLIPFYSPKDKKNVEQEMKSFLKVLYVDTGKGNKSNFFFSIPKPQGIAYDIKDYDYYFERNFSIIGEPFKEVIKADQHILTLVSDNNKLSLKQNDVEVSLEFRPLYEKLQKMYKRHWEHNVPEADMTYILETKYAKLKIVFSFISGSTEQSKDGFKFQSLDMRCFIKIKDGK